MKAEKNIHQKMGIDDYKIDSLIVKSKIAINYNQFLYIVFFNKKLIVETLLQKKIDSKGLRIILSEKWRIKTLGNFKPETLSMSLRLNFESYNFPLGFKELSFKSVFSTAIQNCLEL